METIIAKPARTAPTTGDDVLALLELAYCRVGDGDAHGALILLERALRAISATPRVAAERQRDSLAQPRIHIRTLGGFAVTIDGQPLRTGRKLPRRPLDLLKAIIVFGSQPTHQDTLADALWPELDGDHARNALTAALHRLRHLLLVPGAVAVCDRHVALDPNLVRVDAFEADAHMRVMQAAGPADTAMLESLFGLYRGPFLPDEFHLPWTDRLRGRLRQRFCACVASAASALEDEGGIEDARLLYRRAVALDDGAARLHDGMLRYARLIDGDIPGVLRARHPAAFAGAHARGD